jgi:holin-like protein
VGLILAFWVAGQGVVKFTGFPVPGGVIGMLAILLLFMTRRISIFSIRRGAEWFISDMPLFFVPAVLAVLDHRELLGAIGLKVVATILGSTLAVMAVTALTVNLLLPRK